MSLCGLCNIKIVREDRDKVSCSQCSGIYHKACLKLSESDLASGTEKWRCFKCKERRLSSGSTSSKTSAKSLSQKSASATSTIDAFRRAFEEERQVMRTFREDMERKVDGLIKQNVESNAIMSRALNEMADLRNDNVKLRERVTVLESRLLERDRVAELNAIEITNVPDSISGDVYENASQILTSALNMDITEDNISDCYIIKSPKGSSGNSARGNEPRGRRMKGNIWIVRFTTVRMRGKVMDTVRSMGKNGNWNLRCAGVGDLDFNVSIRERISSAARELFGRTRAVASDAGWKYTWMRNGRIHVRKRENGRVYNVNSFDDLSKLQNESTN